MSERIKLFEAFSGVGAQATALENLGIPFDAVCCEIDDSAYKAYCAIHGDTPNLGDITKVEHLPEHTDLLTYSFPCQDLSIAGLQKGMTEGSGSRSSLLWEVGRLLDDAKERNDLPRYLVMENVDAILHVKNIGQFNKWIAKLTEMGYKSSYKILNATDYGVPQSRRRCFMVSALKEGEFIFPEGRPLDKRLRDVLEDDVPEEFYLSEERIAKYERTKSQQNALGRGFGWKPTTLDGIMSTILTSPTKDCTNTIIVAGDLNNEKRLEQHNRVYDADGVAPTVFTPHGCDQSPKIELAGDLHIQGWHRLANEVYGTEGISPCVHAQSNNLKTKIEEPDLIRVGTMTDEVYEQDQRVYSPDGIAPTLRLGGKPPSVEEKGIIIAGEIPGSNFNGARRVISPEGVAPTITCEHVGINHPKIEVVGDLNIDGKMESSNRVYGSDGISPTIPAACGEGGGITPKIEEGKLRIRYLTPRECWRLQGFDDARIDKAFEAIDAKTVRYKLAGNSIAVPCLEAIFKGIFIDGTFRKRQKGILEW